MSSLGISFKLCVLFVLFALVSNAQIPKDKQLHFAAGIIAGSTGYGYVWNKTKNKNVPVFSIRSLTGRRPEM